MIEVLHLHKSFDEREVLHDICVKFEAGKTNLIIGQSGSGKTVLMKCLIGLYTANAGKILYNNRDFDTFGKKDRVLLTQEMGVLFQGGALFDSMTVEDNVLFPLIMHSKLSQAEQTERMKFCLNRVNLYEARKQFPSQISGGMKKRVAIARAIALNPKYLFCDEPNSGLDPKTSLLIDELIYEITAEYGITTVVNTHDMNSVMQVGDTISFIYEGKLWWRGTNKEILSADNQEIIDFIYTSKFTTELYKIHHKE
ncbi:MAG: ATP-binding cassette domain-containing protein [Lentimicrobiaceae bacterium]|nr:ATP-binding cassette domain-containing protein [Lentimicrobiaceae bacterium]